MLRAAARFVDVVSKFDQTRNYIFMTCCIDCLLTIDFTNVGQLALAVGNRAWDYSFIRFLGSRWTFRVSWETNNNNIITGSINVADTTL